ncbi:MAG: DUF1800 domain-containing protein [Burkholderiales bacterium]|nr:MAG: DUF1800 domain-containing protein [Burkholderiales bacterium]
MRFSAYLLFKSGHPPVQRVGDHTTLSHLLLASVLALSGLLVACGGGGGGGGSDSATSAPRQSMTLSAGMMPSSDADAYRFLTQATFGPTSDDVARVKAIGYDNWIDEQFGMQLQSTHVQMVDAAVTAQSSAAARPNHLLYSWWTHAIKDPAQLRQRVAFALSEIFVVSTSTLDNGRMVASYLDLLTNKADANFRDLLQSVAMHPAMGLYLSHLANRKEDPSIGRVPDENFAREVMQLFSIGLYELDDSGHPRLVNGNPVETYTADDIKGMAKVFTGFSWYRPDSKASLNWWVCFWRTPECLDDSYAVMPMSSYVQEHSTSVKQFLGVTIPAQAVADPAASLKAALDRLASHPNVAPFISKQLIQRLVTSNPSDTYVSDITSVFRATQGNIGAVVKAILLHNEARHPTTAGLSTYGKVREPVLRLSHLLRVLPHTSDTYAAANSSGQLAFYLSDDTSDPGTQLGQTPMNAPSVFNFFRPGFTPQQTQIAAAGLVAPEMQITNETSVLGYANAISTVLDVGWGQWNGNTNRWDIQFDLSPWNSKASNPTDLVNAVSLALLGKPMAADVQAEAVASISNMPSGTAQQRRQRIQAAILFVAVSPDFVIQQ